MFGKKVKKVKSLIWKVIAIKYIDGKISSSEQEIENENFNANKIFAAAKEKGTMIVILRGGSYKSFWIRLSDDNFYSIPLPY